MFRIRNLLMKIGLFLLAIFSVFLVLTPIHTTMTSVQSSQNFKISWDVFDEAGGSGSSNSFKLQDSVGQSSPIGASESASYKIYAGFHVTSVPIPPPPKPGDVNSSGEITAYDASMVLQYVVGIIALTAEQRQAADVTGDDTISALDAALILQYTVGLITSFPVDSAPAAPALNPELEAKLLTEAIEQLDTIHLTAEQKWVLERLKRLISQELPSTTMLFQNFPNPFNSETWIPFQLSADVSVTIKIYNAKGQLVRVLHLGTRKAGVHVPKDRAAYWNGRDSLGQSVASGVYFYTLQAGDFRSTRKMAVVK